MDHSTHMASQRFDIDLKKIGLWGSLSTVQQAWYVRKSAKSVCRHQEALAQYKNLRCPRQLVMCRMTNVGDSLEW